MECFCHKASSKAASVCLSRNLFHGCCRQSPASQRTWSLTTPVLAAPPLLVLTCIAQQHHFPVTSHATSTLLMFARPQAGKHISCPGYQTNFSPSAWRGLTAVGGVGDAVCETELDVIARERIAQTTGGGTRRTSQPTSFQISWDRARGGSARKNKPCSNKQHHVHHVTVWCTACRGQPRCTRWRQVEAWHWLVM
jgi:hypothetical protein